MPKNSRTAPAHRTHKRTSEFSRGLLGLPADRLKLLERGPRAFARGKALRAGGISATKTLDTTMVRGGSGLPGSTIACPFRNPDSWPSYESTPGLRQAGGHGIPYRPSTLAAKAARDCLQRR